MGTESPSPAAGSARRARAAANGAVAAVDADATAAEPVTLVVTDPACDSNACDGDSHVSAAAIEADLDDTDADEDESADEDNSADTFVGLLVETILL